MLPVLYRRRRWAHRLLGIEPLVGKAMRSGYDEVGHDDRPLEHLVASYFLNLDRVKLRGGESGRPLRSCILSKTVEVSKTTFDGDLS